MPQLKTKPRDAKNTPEKVLIVEDNFIIAVEVEKLLRRLGVNETTIVPGVDAALDQLQDVDYDFVWLDVRLGPDSGIVVAHQLLAAKKPFGFLTGYGEMLRVEPMFADVPIVAKPFVIEDLAEAMHDLLV